MPTRRDFRDLSQRMVKHSQQLNEAIEKMSTEFDMRLCRMEELIQELVVFPKAQQLPSNPAPHTQLFGFV